MRSRQPPGPFTAIIASALLLMLPALARGQATRPADAPLFPGLPEAKRVVFLVCAADGTGPEQAIVGPRLREAVNGLKPGQWFNVVYYWDGVPAPLDGNGLVLATPENKAKAAAFIDAVRPRESNNPASAFALALGMRPDVIHVVTPGGFTHPDFVRDRVAAANKTGATKVHVTVLAASAPAKASDLKALEALAKANGGTFRHDDRAPRGRRPADAPAPPGPPPEGWERAVVPDERPQVVVNPNPVARRIVFVCVLKKGTPPDTITVLKSELTKAVEGLKPIQAFDVVFPANPKPATASKDGKLLTGTKDNKDAFAKWLGAVGADAGGDPLPALTAAFADRPQLVYLLASGSFPDGAAVAKKVRELNADGRVKVNTIAYAQEASKDTAYLETLKSIAQANGGNFRQMTVDDLKK